MASPASSTADAVPHWRDRKRYLWLFSTIMPGMVGLSWLCVFFIGSPAFWWLGLVLVFGIGPLLDYLGGADSAGPSEGALLSLEKDRFYRWATYLYLPCQYLSLAFACWLWAGGGWLTMSWLDKLGLMLAVGIVGGCAINVAHEIGHTSERTEKRLSKIALAQCWYGHFPVEHNHGHHVRVATPEDPTSSWFGESFYRFLPRSVAGRVQTAWRLEARRLARHGQSPWSWHNEVLRAWPMSVVLYAGLAVWFGPVVLPWLFGQAVVGICLLEMVNYMEHYGLRRQKLPDGRYERVRPAHSWNSNSVLSNVFLFHLPRHSDHHANPMRPYQALRHFDEAPELPAGYAAMLPLTLVPPLWRRVMDHRVIAHYGGDVRLAALPPNHPLMAHNEASEERQLAAHALDG